MVPGNKVLGCALQTGFLCRGISWQFVWHCYQQFWQVVTLHCWCWHENAGVPQSIACCVLCLTFCVLFALLVFAWKWKHVCSMVNCLLCSYPNRGWPSNAPGSLLTNEFLTLAILTFEKTYHFGSFPTLLAIRDLESLLCYLADYLLPDLQIVWTFKTPNWVSLDLFGIWNYVPSPMLLIIHLLESSPKLLWWF